MFKTFVSLLSGHASHFTCPQPESVHFTNEEGYLHMKTTPRTDTNVKSYALLGTGLE
jgi:hypothetical protein